MTLTSPPAQQLELDLRDLRCPHLLFAVVHAMKTLAPGQILRIAATDLSAPSNLVAWARQSGNPVLETYDDNGVFVIYLRRAALRATVTGEDKP